MSGGMLLAVQAELASCRAALATAAAGDEPPGGLDPETRLAFVVISVFLVLFAGLMAGLTLGLLSLDKIDLEVIKRSGSAHEVWLVQQVEPVLARPHFLLATLLLCNSVAMEALPLFLDRLLNPAAAIILSVSAILVFGEIVPQAVCKRYGLQVGAYMAWFVSFLMLLTAVITWPIGKLLDWVLGEESALFKRRELRALVSIHADATEGGEEAPALTLDEVQVIQGALDMASKSAESAMTPVDKVFALSADAEVNDELLLRILERGHSRLPVYEGDSKQNIVGVVLVKELLLVDEDAGVRIRDLRLRELPFLSTDTLLFDVLKIFRLGRSHMACLTQPGPSGRLEVVGIITIEDVLEELLQQEIVDETDRYVDNMQTVPSSTLQGLQKLPPNLRRFLTRTLVVAAPGGPGGMRATHSAASVGAAAAGAALAASAGGTPGDGTASPRAVAAAAAAAATSVLLSSPRRPGSRTGLATNLEDAERGRARQRGGDGCAYALATVASGGALLAALAGAKPPIPRRAGSVRSLREAASGGLSRQASADGREALASPVRRHSSDALRRPLLESDHEGESPRSPGVRGGGRARTAAPPPRPPGAPAEWQQLRQQQMRELLRLGSGAGNDESRAAVAGLSSPGRGDGPPPRNPPSPFHTALVRSPTSSRKQSQPEAGDSSDPAGGGPGGRNDAV